MEASNKDPLHMRRLSIIASSMYRDLEFPVETKIQNNEFLYETQASKTISVINISFQGFFYERKLQIWVFSISKGFRGRFPS